MSEEKDKLHTEPPRTRENLTFSQRKELLGLMKRMLPPVPSMGIIDIRFSFWFIRKWYVVFIFGKDTRNQFRIHERGIEDKILAILVKLTIYVIMALFFFTILVFLIYLIKSYLGIDIYPNKHFPGFIKDAFRGKSVIF